MAHSISDQLKPMHDLRVILVGRTGLEGSLRLDGGLELVRVVSGVDAIGELGCPIDDESPDRAVVVLGPEQVQLANLDSLITSLRRVDPQVRIACVGVWTGQPQSRPQNGKRTIDRWLNAGATADDLRAMFESEPSARPGANNGSQRYGSPTTHGETHEDEREAESPIPQRPPVLKLVDSPAADGAESDHDRSVAELSASTDAPSDAADMVTVDDDEREALTGAPMHAFDEHEGPAALDEDAAEDMQDNGIESLERDSQFENDPGAAQEVESLPPAVTPASNRFGRSTEPQIGAPSRATTWTALEASEDLGILRTLLSGGDVVPACLTRLRRRLAPNPIDFIAAPPETDPPRPKLGPGLSAAEVKHRGRVYGWLTGPIALRADLEVLAEWLAYCLALQEQHSQLRMAAYTDPLTRAWNRRYFEGFLGTSIEQARQRRNSLTLLFFDVDDFKSYNDQFGHEAGDQILRELVKLLRSVIRPTDRVCRIGGDEFAVIFYEPEGPRDPSSRHPFSIVNVVERFQKQILAHRFPKLSEGAMGRLTISGGLATFPWDGLDIESLIRRADQLVLESKRQGKGKICIGPGVERMIRENGC